MKNKLPKFLEISGIILAIAVIAVFVTLAVKELILYAVCVLILGFMGVVIFFAVAQVLYSISNIELDVNEIAQRVSLIEERNREVMQKELFASKPSKPVQQRKQAVKQTAVPKANPQGPKASCMKCGYSAPFSGNNICPKCGNHSFYLND